MYNKGDHVVYGSNGPCLVTNITRMSMPGSEEKRRYYVLQPMNSPSSTIYSPIDNERVNMRPILSRKAARELLNEVEGIEELEVESEKVREIVYKEVLRECDPRQFVAMIKTLYKKRDERIAQGRKFTAIDEKYLREVMNMLCIELSLALGSKQETATKHLLERLGEET